MVILFFRGLICFAEDGADGSSVPAPPRLRARLRVFFVVGGEIAETTFRRGLGWIGALSLFCGVDGVAITVPFRDFLPEVNWRGERLAVFGEADIIVARGDLLRSNT
jgi:hypothetical protein